MTPRSWFQLYRGRLIAACILSAFSALLMLFWTTAEYPTDFGILWHHFCGCPPDPADTSVILHSPMFACTAMGILLGLGVGSGFGPNTASAPSTIALFFGPMRFLLTRPEPRWKQIVIPALMAALTISVLPAAGLLLLLGWLRLVGAPALDHLLALVRLIPDASHLDPHPPFAAVLLAAHFPLHYLAAISVGLCAYAIFFSQRWMVLSSHRWVRLASGFVLLSFTLPSAVPLLGPRLMPFVFLVAPRHGTLAWLPSIPAVAIHFAFAAACLYGCWTIAREAEV